VTTAAPVEPVDELAQRVTELAGTAIDTLQVAALLESQGVTDRSARETYGYDDVFRLAEEVYGRLPRTAAPAFPIAAQADRWQTWRELSHGLLYALPTVAYPAVLVGLDTRTLVVALVYATAAAWVFGMGVSWVGYRLLSRYGTGPAGRWLRLSGLAGLVAVLLGGLLVRWLAHTGGGLILLSGCQMGFQLAAGALLFYRLERWLVVMLSPGLGFAVAYLVMDRPRWFAGVVVGAAVGSVVLALGTAWAASLRVAPPAGVAVPTAPRGTPRYGREIAGALPIVGYAAVCAGYLLFTDSQFVLARTDLAVGATPLVLGMGVLEWRARRYGERSLRLLTRTYHPAEFGRKVRVLLLRNLAGSLLILAALAALPLLVLHQVGLLSGRGVLMTAAHVLLGGAYFVGFLLIGQRRLPALLVTMASVGVVDVAATVRLARLFGRYGTVPVFLTCTAVLLVLLVVVLGSGIHQIWRYRQ
jgi:hypothetical protein